MSDFHSYQIINLELRDLDQFSPPDSNCFILFWWRNIPLGQLWFERTVSASLSQFKQLSAEAIEPSLNHYLNIQHRAGSPAREGTEYLRTGNHGALLSLLERSSQVLQSSPPRKADALSVVVCTRNRPHALQQCILRLLESNDQNFELIVVDNAPDNHQTEEIVKGFPTVRYVKEERIGLDLARNKGIQAASHPIIAFTDDDVLVDKDWTSHIKGCFDDKRTMSVTGPVIPMRLQNESEYLFEKYWGLNKGYLPQVFDHQYFLDHLDEPVPVWDIGAGANMAFRKELFQQIGGFDERLDVGKAGCSGDSEFWYRVLAAGWTCRYLPHVLVYHNHRQSLSALKRQVFLYMRGHVCGLLVQKSRYHHKSNLRRLYRTLPKYYWGMIKKRIKEGKSEQTFTLTQEIKGCFSGWLYYYWKMKRMNPGIALVPGENR
jgi:GT2 family glycosyltransferase